MDAVRIRTMRTTASIRPAPILITMACMFRLSRGRRVGDTTASRTPIQRRSTTSESSSSVRQSTISIFGKTMVDRTMISGIALFLMGRSIHRLDLRIICGAASTMASSWDDDSILFGLALQHHSWKQHNTGHWRKTNHQRLIRQPQRGNRV